MLAAKSLRWMSGSNNIFGLRDTVGVLRSVSVGRYYLRCMQDSRREYIFYSSVCWCCGMIQWATNVFYQLLRSSILPYADVVGWYNKGQRMWRRIYRWDPSTEMVSWAVRFVLLVMQEVCSHFCFWTIPQTGRRGPLDICKISDEIRVRVRPLHFIPTYDRS